MKNKVYSFYIIGRREGYLDVRLEPVLKETREIRAIYLKGYQLGRQIRKNEELVETEEERKAYLEKRKAYITSMGFDVAREGLLADSSSLKGEDKEAYELGINAGRLCNRIEYEATKEIDAYKKQSVLTRNE